MMQAQAAVRKIHFDLMKKLALFSLFLGFKLNVLSDPSSESECPPNSMIQSKKCNCRSGFRDNNNNRCGRRIF